jgi:hypothetical protein
MKWFEYKNITLKIDKITESSFEGMTWKRTLKNINIELNRITNE